MTLGARPGSRAAFIGLCAVLMGSTIYVVGESLREGRGHGATQRETVRAPDREIPHEAAVFRLSRNALSIAAQPAVSGKSRDLTVFYQRRAYLGAPPVIPHAVKADMAREPASCVACHERGGYVAEFKAFAPVTPHPELVSCRQCHVPAATQPAFKETLWESVSRPALKRAALPGSPPQIPHGLAMRENCLACHGGSGAAKDIRVSHPERANCRQCHAAVQEATIWTSAPGGQRE